MKEGNQVPGINHPQIAQHEVQSLPGIVTDRKVFCQLQLSRCAATKNGRLMLNDIVEKGTRLFLYFHHDDDVSCAPCPVNRSGKTLSCALMALYKSITLE